LWKVAASAVSWTAAVTENDTVAMVTRLSVRSTSTAYSQDRRSCGSLFVELGGTCVDLRLGRATDRVGVPAPLGRVPCRDGCAFGAHVCVAGWCVAGGEDLVEEVSLVFVGEVVGFALLVEEEISGQAVMRRRSVPVRPEDVPMASAAILRRYPDLATGTGHFPSTGTPRRSGGPGAIGEQYRGVPHLENADCRRSLIVSGKQ
jgi:hypothetical protein